VEDGVGITKLNLTNQPVIDYGEMRETPLLRRAAKQLEEYLSCKRKEFDLPLHPKGTEFQKKVWDALGCIPYGEKWSYKKVAEAINKPTAARAVGMANNKNPIMIVIPCHRVIGSNGKLVGYAGGLALKETLLAIEENILY
jgi:methylated-DNA-[protein]-cysteine S-methyltransferase